MDAITCPYTPGAGTVPRELAGRDAELEQFRVLLGRLNLGNPEQSLLVTGLRGVGKTVLLEAFEGVAQDQGWVALSAELTNETRLPKLVATLCRRALLDLSRTERIKDRAHRAFGILKSFTVSTAAGVDFKLDFELEQGVADSGDLARDLADLLIEVGAVAREGGRGVVLLLDEVQFLEKSDFEGLIAALHLSSRKAWPITVVGAGLPMLPKLAGDAKSYSERLFRFPRIGALPEGAASDALAAPAATQGVKWHSDALKLAFEYSGRYPYFLQEYGKHAWLTAEGPEITAADVTGAHPVVLDILDNNFFHTRIERCTDVERRYLAAIADLGDGPQKSGEVSRTAGYASTTETGPMRDSLIKKGLVFSPRHGEIDFTAPHFADFMRRCYPLASMRSQ